MKSTTFASCSLLAASVAAIAQPHRHQHLHQKRGDIVWVTDYDYVTETIDLTTTIWVPSASVPPSTSTKLSTWSLTSSVSPSVSPSEVPAQFFGGDQAPSSSSIPSTLSMSTTSSVHVAPPPSSTYVPPPLSEAPPASVAPVPSSRSSSPAPVFTPPSTFAAPVAFPPTTTSEAPAPVATPPPSSSSSSGSSGGQCSSGSPCTGDMTFYTAGLGACGWTNDGDSENVVALPHGMMGTQSNGNPFCGKMITIRCSSTGKTTTAMVVDKCMGCTGFSIDLSNAAFLDLDSLAVGRTTAEWWFN